MEHQNFNHKRTTATSSFLFIAALLAWWLACWFVIGNWIDHQAQTSYRLESQHAQQFVSDAVPSFNRILTTRSGVPRMLARDPEISGTLARFGAHPPNAAADEEARRKLWSNDAMLIKTSKLLHDSAKELGLDVLSLLNANGDCVASSSIDSAQNSIGTNYRDHDNFLRARAGQSGYLPVVGKKRHSAGLNFYAPVMHQGRFVGVVSGGNALASFANLVKQADAYLSDSNGVVILARDPSLMMHVLPNAAFDRLDAATRQARYQSTELPTLQLAPWGHAQFPELLRVQGRDTPAILRSHSVTDGGLILNVLWPMPELIFLEQQRLLYTGIGGLIGTLLMLLTVTRVVRRRDQRKLTQGLVQREREFRSLADNMPDNVIRWDVNGRYLYLNPVHERTLGAAACDMIGKAIPDSHVNVKAAIAQVLATGQAVLMVQQSVPDEHGEMRLHDVSIVPERDEAGEIVSVLGIGRDMTEIYRMQEALATREQAFRSLAESSPDFITRYDREGRHLYLNDRLLRQIGLASADEALGKRPGEVWPDGRFAELEQVVARAMESGCQGEIEIVEPAEGGGFRYHQIFVVPEHDAGGRVIGAIAFGREITAIREAEHKLAHFINNLPGLAYTFRLSPDGRGCFPYVSPAIEELYGLKPEDVKDDMAPIHALAHPDDRPHIEAAIAESARTMRPFQIESRICRTDKPERWIDVRSMPELQADGSLLWYGLMLDITERKRAQVELQRSEHELRRQAQFQQSLLSTLIDAGVVLCVVENGKFVYTNDHYLGCQLGYAKGQMPATVEFIDLIHPDDRPRIAEMYRNRLAGKPLPSSYEIGALGGDGSRLDYEFHVTVVPDSDPVQTLVFALNIAERKRLEIELKQRETEFRALTENLPDPVFRYDRDCLRTYVNPAAVRITGLPIEQLIGNTPENCATTKPENAGRTMLAIREVFSTGERRSHFVEYVNEDGSMSEYQGLHVPEFDANGQVASVLTIAHEVTNLRAAEQRAASFFANMPGFAYTFVVSPEGRMRFLFASQGIEDIFGLRPEDVRDDAAPMRATAHSDDWPRVEAAIIEAARTQQPFQVEARMQRLGQPERWIECRSMPEQQAGGEVLWHGIMLDITGRKLAEQALDEARQRLHSVLQGIPDPVWMKDAEGAFVVCNPGVARLFNMREEEIVGKNDYDFFDPEQAEFYRNKDRTALEAGDVCINEEWWTFADNGERVLMETRKVPVVSTSGKLLGVLGVARDITERKRMEAAREAALTEAVRLAKTRSEFLAHMSHELRTPLNGILGYTQILQRDKALNPHHVEALAVMRQSGEHLLALIEDILDLARIEAGRLTLDASPISLAAFLRGVTDIVRVRANEKDIEFICNFAPDLPADIRGDEKRLRQVLLNLLANAVKFTHQGRVVLHVSRVDVSRLAFVVEDTGVGIPSGELETIFQPFEQSGNAQQHFGGSGLGLSISRQLMRLMGGDIWVESHLGVGSRFGFELELPATTAVSMPVFVVPEVDRRNQPLDREPSVGTLDRRMLAPPAEELQALYRLAQLGNMRDIQQYAQHMAAMDAQHQPFAAHLQQMARAYQSKAILAFVSMYLRGFQL